MGTDARLAAAISEQESGYGQHNNSDMGARGPMQLLPSTAAQYGVSDICDSVENIRGGIAFLHDLNVEFGGNIMLIVAAYNAGPRRVYQANGIPAIPETVNYVARVTNTYYQFDNSVYGGKRAKPETVLANINATSAHIDAAASEAGTTKSVTPPHSNIGSQWVGSVLYVDQGGDQ